VMYEEVFEPQMVVRPSGVSRWISVTAGYGHCLALADDGRVFAWGGNQFGQLGNGSTTNTGTPTVIPGVIATAITAGRQHSLAIADCGVLAWGDNRNGQLGIGVKGGSYSVPTNAVITRNLCDTNTAGLPIVSIVLMDSYASEHTYRSRTNLGVFRTNSAAFALVSSRALTSPLTVAFSVGGTADNGQDYQLLPHEAVIPAGGNSVTVPILPSWDDLAEAPESIIVTLQSAASYVLGAPTNATITLDEFEYPPTPPLPFSIPLNTNLAGANITIEASTNLTDWVPISTVSNATAAVSFVETNAQRYTSRFFRVVRSQ
jgi:hypothetical protein